MLVIQPVSERKGGKKVSALLIAILVHAAVIAIALLIAVMPNSKKEPEIVAQVVAPVVQTEIKLEKKQVVKQAREASAAAAASPIAKLIRANSVAKIAVPEVTKFSDGPIGLGEGDFGSGFGNGGGGGGAGMGTGATMFGNRGGQGLVGRLYDLKQNRSRRPTSIDVTRGDQKEYLRVIQDLARQRFSQSAFQRFYRAPNPMSYTFLAIPTVAAEEGPAAFAVEKEVKPMGWIVHYTGVVSPPQPGRWRFVGIFDDSVIVFINGEVVLDGSWRQCFDEPGVREEFGGPELANGRPPFSGKWVNLSGPFKMDIIIGECPGGELGGGLMVQHEGERYRKRKDGTLILPVFSTVKLDSSARKQLRDFPYDFAGEAIFRPTTSL